jgi:hypothetical protein
LSRTLLKCESSLKQYTHSTDPSLPFRIRSKGLMIMQMCVSASLVFNQYVNPIALDALAWKYYIVYTIWIGFE